MKTTDSVMREKLKEIMSTPAYPTAPACPYCDFAKGRDYSKTGIQHHIRKAHPGKENTRIDRIVDLFSHSLAEARREWVEEMRKGFDKKAHNLTENDEYWGITSENMDDLLTGDNPERK